jgi:hypothetical protein
MSEKLMKKTPNSEAVANKWIPIAGAVIFGCAFLGIGISEAVKYNSPEYWEYRKIQEQERTKRSKNFFSRDNEAPVSSDTSFKIKIGD